MRRPGNLSRGPGNLDIRYYVSRLPGNSRGRSTFQSLHNYCSEATTVLAFRKIRLGPPNISSKVLRKQ